MRIRRQDFAGLVDEWASFNACVWPVADDYKLVGDRIYPEGGWKLTFPLKHPDLFISFARLGSRTNPSDESIRRWVLKHGLLLGEDVQESGQSETYWLDPAGHVAADQSGMQLQRFKSEIGRASDLLGFYADLQSKDIGAIEARAAEPKTDIDTRLITHPDWHGLGGAAQKAYGGLSDRPGYEWNLWVATKVLADALTEAASGVRLRATLRDTIQGLTYYSVFGNRGVFFDPPYAMSSTWYCPDLLSAMYLQFYLLVTAQKTTRRCENPACLMPFHVTRKDKRFCNSTCRSNARNYPK